MMFPPLGLSFSCPGTCACVEWCLPGNRRLLRDASLSSVLWAPSPRKPRITVSLWVGGRETPASGSPWAPVRPWALVCPWAQGPSLGTGLSLGMGSIPGHGVHPWAPVCPWARGPSLGTGPSLGSSRVWWVSQAAHRTAIGNPWSRPGSASRLGTGRWPGAAGPRGCGHMGGMSSVVGKYRAGWQLPLARHRARVSSTSSPGQRLRPLTWVGLRLSQYGVRMKTRHSHQVWGERGRVWGPEASDILGECSPQDVRLG